MSQLSDIAMAWGRKIKDAIDNPDREQSLAKLHELAALVADARYQEQRFLRDEVSDLRQILIAAIESNGGRLEISELAMRAMTKDLVIVSTEDKANRKIVLTLDDPAELPNTDGV